jgi:uncharacterized integral membrane protein
MRAILVSLLIAVFALVGTDDRMSGISWSLSAPNIIAVCAVFVTLALMARNAKNSLEL